MKISGFLSATALASSLAFAIPAWAQTVSAQPEQTQGTSRLDSCPPGSTDCAPEESGQNEPDLITVTGSRIRLPNVTSLEPTVTVDSAYIEQRNLTNVADALNEIPGFRGSVTPNGTQGSFGQGVNFVNALGLGSNRSLTLLNGRRVVSSNLTTIFGNAAPGTQVDLNIIPTILVDRIDRVAIGGAPVYGSDAIASTVNVILKKRFNGVQLRATSGITEQGDNFRYSIEGVAGTDFADGRGNISVSASFEQVDGMLYNDRDFFRQNRGVLNNPTSAQAAAFGPAGRTPANDGRVNPNIGFNNSTTDGFPGAVLVNGVTIPSLTRGGLLVNNTTALRALDYNFQFDGNSNLVPFNRGILYNGAINSSAARASGGDGFNFSDYTQITSNIRRLSTFAFANYDLTDEVRLFAEGTYYRGQGDQLVRQPTFNATLFGGASSALVFTPDNPFLSAQARNLLVQNGYSSFRLSRSNLDLSDASGSAKNDLYRGVVGASSEFKLGGRDYYAEVSLNYGRNEFTDFNQAINQQNFVNAVNVTRNAAGQIVCTATPTVNATPGFTPVADANCVPLNLFGENAASQAARNYVIADVTADSLLEQYVANASVGGSPFDVFGNPIGVVVGFEHREEKASFQPNAFQVNGLGRSVAILPTSGSYNLDEVFGEIQVPLISPNNELSFLHSADVFARGRYVDNTVNGGFFAWAAGGSIAPVQDLKFRGNFTRSFRAPAIVELFAPRTNTFVTVPDLCNAANINAGPAPANRARNCAAFLARYPNGTPLAASFATVPGVSGGNPVLDNEQADSFTFGVIMQPRFVPGFSWTVDYLDIHLTKPIASLTATTIASACFDNASFDTSDPANGNSFCSLIRRDDQGQVIVDPINPGVSTAYINGQQIDVEAIESTMDYRTKLTALNIPGNLSLRGQMLFLRRRIVDTTGVAPARSDGTVGDPQFQGQFQIGYDNDDWGFNTNINYVGEQLVSRFNRGPSPNDTRELDEYPDFITIDSSLFVEVQKNFLLTFSVTNLTNRIGLRYYGGYVPAAINDPFGRSFRVSTRIRF